MSITPPPTPAEIISLMTTASQFINPYKYSLQALHNFQYQLMYPQVFNLLTAMIVVHFILFVQTCVSLAIKTFLKKRRQNKMIWLWRRHYLSAFPEIPYYVPNGEFAVEISQLFGCLCFEIYGFINYYTLKNPDATGASTQFLWMAISYAPGFFGFWYYGFSALYITLLTPSQTPTMLGPNPSRILHPVFINFACIGTPIAIGVTFLGLGASVAVAHTKERESYRVLQELLEVLSAQWTPTDPTIVAKIAGLLPKITQFYDSAMSFLALCRHICLCWSAVSLFVGIFYCATTASICKMLRDTANVASGKKSVFSSNIEAGNSSPWDKEEGSQMVVAKVLPDIRRTERLEKSYHFLAWHCGIITVALMWYFVASLILAVKMPQIITEASWRATCFWLVSSSALFISGALCLQSVWSVTSGRLNKSSPIPSQGASQSPSQESKMTDSINFEPENAITIIPVKSCKI